MMMMMMMRMKITEFYSKTISKSFRAATKPQSYLSIYELELQPLRAIVFKFSIIIITRLSNP